MLFFSSLAQHVCELLSFFVTKHTYRIKYFILRNNVLCRVLKLARLRDKGLVLGEYIHLSYIYIYQSIYLSIYLFSLRNNVLCCVLKLARLRDKGLVLGIYICIYI